MSDARGKTIACFASAKDAAALQRIVKKTKTRSSCDLARGLRGRRW